MSEQACPLPHYSPAHGGDLSCVVSALCRLVHEFPTPACLLLECSFYPTHLDRHYHHHLHLLRILSLAPLLPVHYKTPDLSTPCDPMGGSELPRFPHWGIFLGLTGLASSYLEGFVLGSLIKEGRTRRVANMTKNRTALRWGRSLLQQIFMLVGWFLNAYMRRASPLMQQSGSFLGQV